MDIDNFTSLPSSVLDDLYEEPAKLDVYSFEDYLKLPMNDLYLKENGAYQPKQETKPEAKAEEPEPEEQEPHGHTAKTFETFLHKIGASVSKQTENIPSEK